MRHEHEADLYSWAREQAAALRAAGEAGINAPVDWINVAEEIESLGNNLRRELTSRIATIIEHLIKLDVSPARDPRAGWMQTIRRERLEIDELLDDSPSLRREVAPIIARITPRVRRDVTQDLRARGELGPAEEPRLSAAGFAEDQVVGEWFPDGPGNGL
jgi:hypothetical protein